MEVKKKIIFLFTILLIIAVSACSSDSDEGQDNAKEPIVEENLNGYTEEPLDLENYNLEYIAETDTISFFESMNRTTKSELGYYFWGAGSNEKGDGIMMFYDKVSGEAVPLCNQPDCSHNKTAGDKCTAWFSAINNSEIRYDRNFIQYYEGYIYILARDTAGCMYLYRVAEDGSSSEQYMTLYKQDLSVPGETDTVHYSTPYICLHRGYVYYIDNKESEPKIRRQKLGSDNVEVVFELKAERASVYRMMGYGDYLFFQAGCYTDDKYEDFKGGIYAYNIQTGKLQLVKKDVIRSYTVRDNILYYGIENNVYKNDLSTGETLKILETEVVGNIKADGQYIYVDGSNTLNVYDLEGNKVCDIVDDNIWLIGFGDEEYIFSIGMDEEAFIGILKISDIASGEAKWQYIK